jgi:superfamily II DNA helicase RecQ
MEFETTEQLRVMLRQMLGLEPRPQQVEAIATPAIQQKDLILIARTGWGKSMIFQAIPAL